MEPRPSLLVERLNADEKVQAGEARVEVLAEVTQLARTATQELALHAGQLLRLPKEVALRRQAPASGPKHGPLKPRRG